jgi:cytochrome-b5 reductase
MLALPFRYVRPTKVLGGLAVGSISYACIRTVHAESASPAKIFGRGPALISLPLESSEIVNHNTRLLRFKLPNETDISGLPLTCESRFQDHHQHPLTTRIAAVLTASWPKGHWLPVARPYTPVSASDSPGKLELLVKRYPNGKQSSHLHSLQPGDSLLFVAALPGFKWQPNIARHVTLIAGGSGITPIYQLARGILGNLEDETKVTLVYAANTEEDVLLKKEFDTFQREFPGRFKAVYAVSQPAEGSVAQKGRVTRELLEEITGSAASSEEKVFVCGPPAMEKALVGDWKTSGILGELGYRKEQVHTF